MDNVSKWKSQISEKTSLPNGKPLPVILLVNKCDIEENQLADDAIEAICKENNIDSWMRVCHYILR